MDVARGFDGETASLIAFMIFFLPAISFYSIKFVDLYTIFHGKHLEPFKLVVSIIVEDAVHDFLDQLRVRVSQSRHLQLFMITCLHTLGPLFHISSSAPRLEWSFLGVCIVTR